MKIQYRTIILLLILVPQLSFAQGTFPTGDHTNTFPTGSSGADKVKLDNPLGNITSFPQLIEAVLNALFIIGVPVAVLFIVLGGFRFVWARGNPEKLKVAKVNLFFTIIGIAVFFGAVLITKVIVGTLERLGVNL